MTGETPTEASADEPDALDAVDSIASARDEFIARIAASSDANTIAKWARDVVIMTRAMDIVSQEAVEQMRDEGDWPGGGE